MYAPEVLDRDSDDGTMPENVKKLEEAVIGRRIVTAEAQQPTTNRWGDPVTGDLVLTLDDGRQVVLISTSDCCAYTSLMNFLLHPESVDHMILGVGTTDGYETWHIYADMGDVLTLDVGWSAGNPFYYGYGFHINVKDIDQEGTS